MKMPKGVTGKLSVLSGLLAVLGLVLILVYCFATEGQHLRYLAVALTTAIASFLVGCLVGFLFGIPRVVSTGALRLAQGEKSGEATKADGSTEQFTPSTNLSEISDWLTKLLLGAGLVQLGSLGRPAGGLLQAVARGITPSAAAAPASAAAPAIAGAMAAATAMAGAIIVAYLILGFLDGYVVTTLWYGRRLSELPD